MLYYSVGKDPLPHHLIRRRGKKQFIKDRSRFHLCSSYLLLHVKHLRRDGTPNMIRLLSAILERPGMRMLFMVTKVGYIRKKRRKAQVVSDMRERHSRRFQSAHSWSAVTDQETKEETPHPKPALPQLVTKK